MSKSIDIGIVVAMQEEAEMIASSIGLKPITSSLGTVKLFANDNTSIVLITPGFNSDFLNYDKSVSRVGKVPAAVVTAILINQYNPKIIMNVGTCGGIISSNVKIGEVIVANSITQHDVRIPLPGYREYGTRVTKIKTLEKLGFIKTPHKIGLRSTGESFSTSKDEWMHIKKKKPLAKEMEAVAVLQTVEMYDSGVLFYVIKSVTDVEDENTHDNVSAEQFTSNFKLF